MILTDKNFKEEVLESDIPVLVEFWGSWCPPCQRMKEVLKKLEEAYKGRVKVCELNIDRNPVTAFRYHIKGVPAYIIFYRGKVIHRDIAAKSLNQLKDMVDRALDKISAITKG